jgi:hypothetical protein
MFYKILMQFCVHDVFGIKFSSFTCYDTVLYYDTTHISLTLLIVINWCASFFANFTMHDI